MDEGRASILKFDGSDVEPDLGIRVVLETDQQEGVVPDNYKSLGVEDSKKMVSARLMFQVAIVFRVRTT